MMSMTIETHAEAEPEILYVTATGKFSLEGAKRTFLEMLAAVAANNSTKVLFDGRELIGEPSTIERFYYGAFAAEESHRLIQNMTWFAYVLKEPILDPGKLGENVAVNRGMRVKAFENPDDALNWLLSPPSILS